MNVGAQVSAQDLKSTPTRRGRRAQAARTIFPRAGPTSGLGPALAEPGCRDFRFRLRGTDVLVHRQCARCART
eukprot:4621148-Prymnesium_polylepis.1